MKKLVFTRRSFSRVGLLFCLIQFTIHLSFSQGIWTWMSGPNTLNSGGVFGTQGVPSVNNHPPCEYSSFCWTDLQGNFWLFGGSDAGIRYYGDMWMFNPNTLEWTWVMGNGTQSPAPVFGTQGVAAPGNTPGGRYWSSCTWVDLNGDLWLYGGYGNGGMFGDLWRYNIASNQWTWMAGPNTGGASPVYGTLGVPSASNNPGSRCEIGSEWVDLNGKFWLYGSSGQSGLLSDVWMYDPLINMWTWESGSQSGGVLPVYGTQGVFSAVNTPGGRRPAGMMTENNGNFLLFGGNDGSYGTIYADLWEYNPAINQWAWVNGTQTHNVPAVAGNVCQSDPTFYPDSRFENKAVWKDCAGNFWMFGGCEADNTTSGDIWVFLNSNRQWARMSASSYINASPVYGALGVPSASNQPGAKMGPSQWKDKKGNFWVFGGFNPSLQAYDDMWSYAPDSVCVKANCNCTVYVGTVTATRDTLCQGSGLTSTLSVGVSSGSLQWLSSTDAVHYTGIAGATASSYTTPTSLTQTTYYRLAAGDSTCADTTAAKPVTVILPAVAGVVTSSPDTVCIGSGVQSVLHVTGNVGGVQWQYSTDGIYFTNLIGATSVVYTTPSALAQTTWYRVVVNNSCGMDSSNTTKILVAPYPVAGAITKSRDSICAGSGVTSDLTDMGSAGNLQWQSSTDGIHFTGLPGQTDSVYTTPQGLLQTTYYRVVAANGCGTDSSNIQPVHIVPDPVADFTYVITGNQVTFNSTGSSKDVTGFSWDFGDNTNTTQPNPTHTFNTIDTFYVCLTVYNNSNCSYTLCQDVVLTPNGVQAIEGQTAIQLYPNPANNSINLLVTGIEGNYQLKMYNVLGQLVGAIQPLTLHDKQIITLPLANLPPGSYQLLLTNGSELYCKRFVHIK